MIVKPKVIGLALTAILGILILGMAGVVQAGTIPITLSAGNYTIAKDSAGFDRITVDGYKGGGSPGEPELPSMVFNVLVPPDAQWSSLALEITDTETETLPGTYHIRPMAPDSTYRDGIVVQDQAGADLVDGKNSGTYDTDAFFPEESAKLLPYSQMRKWKFARVYFCPVQYNPVTGMVKLIKNITLDIRYQVSGERMSSTVLKDRVMDGLAPGMFLNYDQGRAWYETDGSDSDQGPDSKLTTDDQSAATYDYVIITTNAIASGSSKLAAFISHKQAHGHSVLLVTESDFNGLTGQAPNHKAEKIRQWLINNYIGYGIEYVLLIGNPSPYESVGSSEDIPMKMCWPRLASGSDEESPTDGFFADLTGNWDLDGNQVYGEWNDYTGSGGVDLAMEVWVGRIPVYSAAYSTLDAILQKIMDYENEKSIGWRKSALLSMSFSQAGYDGAPLAEQMRDDYLTSGSYSSWRQYQQGSGACSLDSIYTSEEELRGGTVVRDRWAADDYGVVCWWGHGSATSAAVGYDLCWDGTLFSYTQTSSLDDDHPSFVYQCSCTNAYPENSNNLAYSILKQGGIAAVSASRVSWFNSGVGYGDFDGSSTNSGIGYEYVKRLVQALPAGQALYQAKQFVGASTTTRLMNQYDFNLYGDPVVGLNSSGSGGAMPYLMLLLNN